MGLLVRVVRWFLPAHNKLGPHRGEAGSWLLAYSQNRAVGEARAPAGRQDDLLVRLDYLPVLSRSWIVAQIPGQWPVICGRYCDGQRDAPVKYDNRIGNSTSVWEPDSGSAQRYWEK